MEKDTITWYGFAISGLHKMEKNDYRSIKSIETEIENISEDMKTCQLAVIKDLNCYLEEMCKTGVIEELPVKLEEIDIDFWSNEDENFKRHSTIAKIYKK